MRTFAAIVIFLTIGVGAALAQSTAFTYQGFLKDGSTPATGNYTISISLWDAETGGAFINSNTYPTVAVVNGVFTVELDFGESAFSTGAARFVEVAVKPTGGTTFTTLTPRTRVRSVPSSIQSLNSTKLGGVGAASYVLTTDPRLSDARVPLPNSTNYIQNSGSVQANSNFNISGNGTAGGSLSANAINASTHYNLNGLRILGVADTSLFVGHGAGSSITSGSGNSFVGPGAGNSTSTGGGNTFVGYSTGSGNVSGYNNTLIGNQPNVLANNLSNATAVGAFASVGASNSLVLGAISGNNFCSPTTNCETVKVGIGTTTPAFRLDVGGRIRLKQDTGSTGTANTAGIWLFQNTPSIEQGFVGMKDDNNIGLYGNNGGGWSLFTDVSTGVTTVANLGSAGSTTLCRNASFQISSCSSSARYKDNINTFTSGLDLIRRLRPVSFNWKDGGMADMGLVAEEVAEVDPLLTSTNSKGEVEGVKYDRVGVVLINAVKEQQAQIESLEKQNKSQQEQIELLKKKAAEIDEIKALICGDKPDAQVCKRQD